MLIQYFWMEVQCGKYLGGSRIYRRRSQKVCYTIFRVCAMLQEQGLNVICCTISMFDSVRKWNRENIRNYKKNIYKGFCGYFVKRRLEGTLQWYYRRNTERGSRYSYGY